MIPTDEQVVDALGRAYYEDALPKEFSTKNPWPSLTPDQRMHYSHRLRYLVPAVRSLILLAEGQ